MTPSKRHPRSRRWRAWGSPGLLALFAACSSEPRLAEGEKCRIILHDARTGSHFVLVNEIFAPREAFYSRTREEAATKILSNDSIGYLLGRLESAGFSRYASTGEAPGAGGNGEASWLYAVTVARGGLARTALRRRGDPPEAATALAKMMQDFREVYDSTNQFQSIENPQGRDYFREIQRVLEERRRSGATPQGG